MHPKRSPKRRVKSLAFPDSEHLGAAGRANALSSRFAVLHCHALWVFHFLFFFALHAIRFHVSTSLSFFSTAAIILSVFQERPNNNLLGWYFVSLFGHSSI
jgi:hypothetical protein